mmetsp:Transcript_32675/g.73816  ORF Transcript_32675/g.73816 Transcript_32675/m.73816 type:complete len:124 (+) Transcript_32675:581-952(+)
MSEGTRAQPQTKVQEHIVVDAFGLRGAVLAEEGLHVCSVGASKLSSEGYGFLPSCHVMGTSNPLTAETLARAAARWREARKPSATCHRYCHKASHCARADCGACAFCPQHWQGRQPLSAAAPH